MKVKVLDEVGYKESMLGLSLSYNQDSRKMSSVAWKLLERGGSHVKFLEQMVVWLDITASRAWWVQFDTYRVGVSKQSESTMHTIIKRPLDHHDFVSEVDSRIIEMLNEWILRRDWQKVKYNLPEGFLQRRIVMTCYKTLQHITGQRKNHRLPEWQEFIRKTLDQLDFPMFVLSKEVVQAFNETIPS